MSGARNALLALSLCLAAACGSNDPAGPGNPSPPPDSPNDIDIVVGASGLTTTAFNPNPREVALGGAGTVSVRWVNTDVSGGGYGGGTATAHMIVSDDGAFDSSPTLGARATYAVAFTKPGAYKYHCAIHPNMVGTITVTP
jgi:plastocyanin